MRLILALLLANVSLCGASSAPQTGAPAPAPPVLSQSLTVSRTPAGHGEPIGLVGRYSIMCAIRKDAPTACIGEIGLDLEPADGTTHDADNGENEDSENDGRYKDWHTDRPIAIQQMDLRQLEANIYTRCIYRSGSGPVECWDWDAARQEARYPEPLTFSDVRDVAAESQTCVVDSAGALRCSGTRTCSGPEDVDDGFDPTHPVTVPGVDTARIVANALHMGCVVRDDADATVACWGATGENSECAPEAKAVPNLRQVVDIAVGDPTACALRADNRVFCWGSNARGMLGDPKAPHSWTPIEVPDAHPAVQLENTNSGFAVLRADGSIVAWGRGLLGGSEPVPERLPFERPAVDLVALSGMVCALLDDGAIACDGWRVRYAKTDGRPGPPFEGKTPWVEAPLYRLAPRPAPEDKKPKP